MLCDVMGSVVTLVVGVEEDIDCTNWIGEGTGEGLALGEGEGEGDGLAPVGTGEILGEGVDEIGGDCEEKHNRKGMSININNCRKFRTIIKI